MNINNKIQLWRTMFLTKYDSLDLYDEYVKKISIIDHEELHLDINYGWTLIGITDEPNCSMTNHEYFCIHDDLFDISIKSSGQEYFIEDYTKLTQSK